MLSCLGGFWVVLSYSSASSFPQCQRNRLPAASPQFSQWPTRRVLAQRAQIRSQSRNGFPKGASVNSPASPLLFIVSIVLVSITNHKKSRQILQPFGNTMFKKFHMSQVLLSLKLFCAQKSRRCVISESTISKRQFCKP